MFHRVLLAQLDDERLASDDFLNLLLDAEDTCLLQLGKRNLGNVNKEAFTPTRWSEFTRALTRLAKNNRILTCNDLDPRCPILIACFCSTEQAVASVAITAGENCGRTYHVKIDDYTSNSSLRRKLRRVDYSLRRKTPVLNFMKSYLANVSMFVDEVTFVDRQLGRHWDNPGYARTLNKFVAFLRALRIRNLTLVTSIDPRFELALHQYCVNSSVSLCDYLYTSLPHDRVMMTKRFIVQIDRGFDLVDTREMMRTTGIQILQSCTEFRGELSRAVRTTGNFACQHCHAS